MVALRHYPALISVASGGARKCETPLFTDTRLHLVVLPFSQEDLKQAYDPAGTKAGERRAARHARDYTGTEQSTSGSGCRPPSAIPGRARVHRRVGRSDPRSHPAGFPAMNRLPPDQVRLYNDHVGRVFATPGVQAILKRDLSRLDADREAILSRQVRTALYGEDSESVRAAALLIKVCGWDSSANLAAVSQPSPTERPHCP